MVTWYCEPLHGEHHEYHTRIIRRSLHYGPGVNANDIAVLMREAVTYVQDEVRQIERVKKQL